MVSSCQRATAHVPVHDRSRPTCCVADGATAMDTDAKPDTAAAPDAPAGKAAASDAAAAKSGTAAEDKAKREDGDMGEKKEDGDDEEKKEEPAAPEPGSYEVPNPARVVPAQEKFMAVPPEQRWQPVAPTARAGFMVMKDLRPGG